MQTIILEKPGSFISTQTAPPAPSAGQAIVRVRRIGVCGTDIHAFGGRQPFFNYPRILGHELGVTIEAIDPNDRGLSVGDTCSVEPYLNCGSCIACRRGKTNCCEKLQVLGVHIDGGMRPLISVPINKLHKSSKLSLDQLALVETLGIGAHAVERAAPEKGEFALVIGAGPIGLAVTQFAQVEGAQIIAMDVSDTRLEFVQKNLGVRHTVNPARGDVAQQLRAITGGDLPTVIFDATGNSKSMLGTFDLVAAGGKIVFVGLFQGDVIFNDPNFHRREVTLLATRNATGGTFGRIIQLIETGKIDTTPWITHRLTLDDVPAAFEPTIKRPDLIKAVIEVL